MSNPNKGRSSRLLNSTLATHIKPCFILCVKDKRCLTIRTFVNSAHYVMGLVVCETFILLKSLPDSPGYNI